ncbi:MAG: cyclic nucleotide-binding domain-containing protein [Planctomycetes bacterium]|nr:cyclic nucleotide-binding domain-containing protein [Planctomycetota bacterium]
MSNKENKFDDEKQLLPLLDIEEILPVLNKISIFAGLSEKQLYTLFQLLEKGQYKAGENIFNEGQKPSHIYIVQSGRVKLVVDAKETPLELIVFEEGQCFGETAVIGIQTHAATAISVEDTELIVLSRKALLSLFKTDLELFSILILNIAREACRRLHKTDEILMHYVLRK